MLSKRQKEPAGRKATALPPPRQAGPPGEARGGRGGEGQPETGWSFLCPLPSAKVASLHFSAVYSPSAKSRADAAAYKIWTVIEGRREDVESRRCPRCGQLSFSARTNPPWPCPFCAAECFYAPNAPLQVDKEGPESETGASEAAEGLNASPQPGLPLARTFCVGAGRRNFQ